MNLPFGRHLLSLVIQDRHVYGHNHLVFLGQDMHERVLDFLGNWIFVNRNPYRGLERDDGGKVRYYR